MEDPRGATGSMVRLSRSETPAHASASVTVPRPAGGTRGRPPAVTAPSDPLPPLSRWSLTGLAVTAVVLVGALLLHLTMTFLHLAPTNAVSLEQKERITGYVQPEFGQDWKLFAPNPLQRNDAVGVRLRTSSVHTKDRTSKWINLTARDIAQIEGNPLPSHVHQNMLRRAWDNYVQSHTEDDRPDGPRGELAAAYMKRVVLQRLGQRWWRGEPITAVQVAGRYTVVPPPAWSKEKAPDTTTYRVLPWWRVTDQDYRGL